MDFFNSLTLDLKMIVVGIAGCVLLALFSGNHKAEKRYLVLLALLSAGGIYRFQTVPVDDPAQRSAATRPPAQTVKAAAPAPAKRTPLVSTSAPAK
jgi:hypothetical protein